MKLKISLHIVLWGLNATLHLFTEIKTIKDVISKFNQKSRRV